MDRVCVCVSIIHLWRLFLLHGRGPRPRRLTPLALGTWPPPSPTSQQCSLRGWTLQRSRPQGGDVASNNNNSSRHDNIHGPVMTQPLWQFTHFIWWMQNSHRPMDKASLPILSVPIAAHTRPSYSATGWQIVPDLRTYLLTYYSYDNQDSRNS